MARINRTIELLTDGESVYYVGGHTGHVLTHEQGRQDAGTWADYINIGMEHGAFDMTGLDQYMRGLVDGGPKWTPHADSDRRVPRGGRLRGDGTFQRLAVPADPGTRSTRYPAVHGRVRRRCSGVRGELPLPHRPHRRR